MTIAAALENFLEQNRISQEDWTKAGCDWSVLQAIAADYEASQDLLRETAEAFARIIQKFTAVHSVRWRVKDVNHLLEKIVRKKAGGSAKYHDLDVANYQQIVTDLVGIRAIHLFKDECFEIDDALRSVWKTSETPIAYFREGDDQTLRDLFEQRGFTIEDHKAGYRSVHYVFPSSLTQREIHVEVQVRTIFEEGWSEIDHRVRYPNYDSAPEVDIFLTIFNRTAGSADEMGSFVRNLARAFKVAETAKEQVEAERDEAVLQMNRYVDQLADAEQKGLEQSETIKKMRVQIEKIKRTNESAKAPVALPGLIALSNKVPSIATTALVGSGDSIGKLFNPARLGVQPTGLLAPGLFGNGITIDADGSVRVRRKEEE